MTNSRDRTLLFTYAAAIFVSAFLLFQIQPLVSKRLLPWFGGSAAVWTTCLLFFQSFLFAGYAYAHLSNTWLRPRYQVVLHMLLVALALVLLPAFPGDQWEPTGGESPIPLILLILMLSVGLPYFVLSATGPLLQAWFARSFADRMPYRLYALSNLGSLLALLSYPLVFEPVVNIRDQSRLWSVGFAVYAALIAMIAWQTTRASAAGRGQGALSEDTSAAVAAAPPAWHYGWWLILSAFSSLVLIATTNNISTDIAVMPLLWVVPLALYLITFIIAFDRPNWYRRLPLAIFTFIAIYAAAATHKFGLFRFMWYDFGSLGIAWGFMGDPTAPPPTFTFIPAHFLVANFAALFGICLLCHGELVRSRPAPRFLTAFYLMIAAGGAVGGMFATVVAPLLFKTYFEWDASLFIAALASLAIIFTPCIRWVVEKYGEEATKPRFIFSAGALVLLVVVTILAVIDLTEFLGSNQKFVRWSTRNFFGRLAIQERDRDDSRWHRFVLSHGTTTHGSQFVNEPRRSKPTTYYSEISAIRRTIDFYHKQLPPGKLRIGVVGLGTGTLAAYAQKGETVAFYEINPVVVDIAEKDAYFTYISDCRARGANCEIHLGDARITLRRELEQKKLKPYNVLVLDAFSGDSIPVHLLTRQAFETYLACITPSTNEEGKPDEGGAIAVHYSNLFLDLEPVVRAMALHFNLLPLQISNKDDPSRGIYASDWIILTHNRALAADLAQYARPVATTREPVLWTDYHSSLLDVLRWEPAE
jgi:hypothetical protein